MPNITTYVAYSLYVMVPTVIDVAETVSASAIKAAVGVEKDAWLFLRLPRHEYDAKCVCHHCKRYKSSKARGKGYESRPSWMDKTSPWPEWHAWVRMDVGPKNSRLAIRGGEHVIVVCACDVRRFLAELSESGIGRTFALPWYLDAKRLPVGVGSTLGYNTEGDAA